MGEGVSVKTKILWGLVIAFVALGVVTVFVTRYAAILSVRQGPPTLKITPETATGSQNGVTVKAHLVTPQDMKDDFLLVTSFLIFQVAVDNGGKEFVDLDYFKFALREGEHRMRPLSADEVSREITAKFLGTSISAQSTKRQMDMIRKADEAMLNSARVFPGYRRTGWIVFSVPEEMGEAVTLELNQVKTPAGTLDPFVFRFEIKSS